jgi:hypothetical protein
MGKLVFDLGNIYQVPGLLVPNSSILFQILQSTPAKIIASIKNPAEAVEALQNTRKELAELLSLLQSVELDIPDAELVQIEFHWTAKILYHACDRGIWVLEDAIGKGNPKMQANLLADAEDLIIEFEEIWMARNRPGGFIDSLARMERMRSAYLEK